MGQFCFSLVFFPPLQVKVRGQLFNNASDADGDSVISTCKQDFRSGKLGICGLITLHPCAIKRGVSAFLKKQVLAPPG